MAGKPHNIVVVVNPKEMIGSKGDLLTTIRNADSVYYLTKGLNPETISLPPGMDRNANNAKIVIYNQDGDALNALESVMSNDGHLPENCKVMVGGAYDTVNEFVRLGLDNQDYNVETIIATTDFFERK